MSTVAPGADVVFSKSDELRFDELMRQSYKKVFDMAFRLARSRSDAEDLTQDAFYRAYRSFREYQGDRPFENWILRIVTRLFLDLLRSRRRRIQAVSYDTPLPYEGGSEHLYFDVPDESPNPEQVVLEGTYSEELNRVLNSLTADQILLVTLADIENVPYQEIAKIIGAPIGTVRSRLHRTHKLIRARLEMIRREGRAAPALAADRFNLAFR
jgi:RNA polymerase sigma-70 factor, ECF subfamily